MQWLNEYMSYLLVLENCNRWIVEWLVLERLSIDRFTVALLATTVIFMLWLQMSTKENYHPLSASFVLLITFDNYFLVD